jgi:hypothetical protein
VSTLRTIKTVEMKLQNGVQRFTAQEVVVLLNEIRVMRKLLKRGIK